MERTDQNLQRFLTVEQAAHFLGLTEDSLRKMIARDQIPHHRIRPKRILLDKHELEHWVQNSPGASLSEVLDKAEE
ncbi:MAG: helix-turn-helix domain-containing protein [bacterium]|nr:helix-turn-helix domain-containing protein [bacterium]